MNDTAMTYEVPKAFPGVLPDAELKGKQIHISTSKGDIVFEVLADEAPKAASNMIALSRSGFYDGLTFHRVVPDFVIQGGDPVGDGTGHATRVRPEQSATGTLHVQRWRPESRATPLGDSVASVVFALETNHARHQGTSPNPRRHEQGNDRHARQGRR